MKYAIDPTTTAQIADAIKLKIKNLPLSYSVIPMIKGINVYIP